MRTLIDIRYETFSSRNHDVAFTKVVEDRHFNPLRDWLDELPEWDGVVRLENLYIDPDEFLKQIEKVRISYD